MKRNNKGFSLVEFIVTIAIMGLFLGTTIYSASNIPRYRARECSKKITSNLGETKVTSLGKAKSTGDIVWELYKEDEKIYIRTMQGCNSGALQELKPARRISKGKLKLSIVDSSNAKAEITNGKSIRLCFDRATGTIYTCGSNPASIPAGPAMLTNHTSDVFDVKNATASKCAKIVVEANGREYVTEIVPETGKIKD